MDRISVTLLGRWTAKMKTWLSGKFASIDMTSLAQRTDVKDGNDTAISVAKAIRISLDNEATESEIYAMFDIFGILIPTNASISGRTATVQGSVSGTTATIQGSVIF